jgi:thymidylate kinase
VMPILFQAPDVGLIAPDLVIYLDVQPEVFCKLIRSMVFHH